jgi:hypothetical protein
MLRLIMMYPSEARMYNGVRGTGLDRGTGAWYWSRA